MWSLFGPSRGQVEQLIQAETQSLRADLEALKARVDALDPPPETVTWPLTNRSDTSTFRNGRPITGEGKQLLGGLLWYVRNPSEHLDGGRILKHARGGDLYDLARPVRSDLQAVSVAHRLTGHPEFLDYQVMILRETEPTLQVGWRGHDPSQTPSTGASPFRCWPTWGGGQPPDLYGTDLSTMNEVRWHATIAEVARACLANAGKASPAGFDYAAEGQKWLAYLRDEFVPKWSGGAGGWRAAYTGVRRTPHYDNPARSSGAWPLVVNGGEMHSSVAQSHLAHHYAVLTGDTSAAEEAHRITDWFVNADSVVVDSEFGPARVWPHTMPSQGSPAFQAQRVIYTHYTMSDMLTAHLGALDPLITADILTEMATAVAAFLMLPGTPWESGDNQAVITTGDITGGVPRGGMSNRDAKGINHITWHANAYASLLAWDESGRVEEASRAIQARSWAGGWDEPKSPFVHAALLVKHALT